MKALGWLLMICIVGICPWVGVVIGLTILFGAAIGSCISEQ